MEDISAKLLSLTDQELRVHLEASEGYDGTPITPSTRMLLVRKLTRNLLRNSNTDNTVGSITSRKTLSSQNVEDESSNEPTLKPSSDNLNESDNNSKQLYYGVHLPCKVDQETTAGTEKSQFVFTNKKDAMKFMKEYPEARFKVFQTKKEAEEFTEIGAESSKDKEQRKQNNKTKKDTEETAPLGEKTSTFKGPKPQELVQLRKIIERGDVENFLETVWKNPRYLVSSGDTPSILKEGTRYNALHVASKAGNGAMCEAILETVGNPLFINLLYNGADALNGVQESAVSPTSAPKQEDRAVLDCVAYLLDLYLNTPEKGRNETPLHFASKFGKIEAVRVLVSYPMCDRTRPNKFGETPEDLICSRCDKTSENDQKIIRQLIRDRFYVPVLRAGDLSQQASIGEPFTPEKLPLSPQESKKDPKSPTPEINAYAGPMGFEEARDFCRRWKYLKMAYGRSSVNATSPILQELSSPLSSCSSSPLRLCDPDRGLEREGRILANELKIGWMEYWPFLGEFVNFASKDGMQILENYLSKRMQEAYNLKMQTNESRGDEVISDMPDKSDTLDCPLNEDNTVSQQFTPVTALCQAMESCTLSSTKKSNGSPNKPSHHYSCTNLLEPPLVLSPSPLQYVEKSCRIFARRISDSLIREAFRGSKRVASNSVGPEVHHLRRLVSSFKEDSRFLSVDFTHMHSRIAVLAADGVVESASSLGASEVSEALGSLPNTLTYSSSDEEEERERDIQTGGREWRISMRHGLHKIEGYGYEEEVEHVRCLMALIKEFLDIRILALPCENQEEDDRIEIAWKKTKSCFCTWSSPNSSHHHSKASSRASLAAVSRRLSFENLSSDEIQTVNNLTDISRSWKNQSSNNNTVQTSVDNEKFSPSTIFSASEINANEDDADVFYTPPSSPLDNRSIKSSDDEDEVMLDTEEISDIFIEGDRPTKLDLDVLYALEDAGHINPMVFPHIYQWKNLVLKHSAEEREGWLSPYAPRWRRQIGALGDNYMEKVRTVTSPSSMLLSSRYNKCNFSPLAQTPPVASVKR